MVQIALVGQSEQAQAVARWLEQCRKEVASTKAEGKKSCIVKLGSVCFGDDELLKTLRSEGYNVSIWTPKWTTTLNLCDFRLIFKC